MLKIPHLHKLAEVRLTTSPCLGPCLEAADEAAGPDRRVGPRRRPSNPDLASGRGLSSPSAQLWEKGTVAARSWDRGKRQSRIREPRTADKLPRSDPVNTPVLGALLPGRQGLGGWHQAAVVSSGGGVSHSAARAAIVIGRPRWYPWTRSQPSSRTRRSSSSVSTPSQTTFKSRP